MNVYDLLFLPFLGAVFLLYMLVPKKYRVPLLLLASCVFYAFSMPKILPAVLVYTAAIFALGKAVTSAKKRKTVFVLSVIFAASFLVVFRYFDVIFGIFGLKTGFTLEILGLSYVTFQAIAYLADIYTGKIEPCADILSFALYLLYFPKILAGPIELPGTFLGRIENASPDGEALTRAGALLVSGYLRVHVAADLLTPAVTAVFAPGAELTGLSAIFGIIIYAFQFYTNFSGYTDIARAASFLFGIELTENFASPYLADSIKDFWRRWHISLSGWLKYYIYIPLGGNRRGKLRKHLNVITVFAVSGIWHGAGLNFLLWGLLHGTIQVLEDLISPLTEKIKAKDKTGLFRVFRILLTFVTVCLLWTVFRAPTLGDAWHVIRSVFNAPGTVSEAMEFCSVNLVTVTLCAAAIAGAALISYLLRKRTPGKTPWGLRAACVILASFAACVIVFSKLSAAGINFGFDIGGGIGTGIGAPSGNNFNYF